MLRLMALRWPPGRRRFPSRCAISWRRSGCRRWSGGLRRRVRPLVLHVVVSGQFVFVGNLAAFSIVGEVRELAENQQAEGVQFLLLHDQGLPLADAIHRVKSIDLLFD